MSSKYDFFDSVFMYLILAPIFAPLDYSKRVAKAAVEQLDPIKDRLIVQPRRNKDAKFAQQNARIYRALNSRSEEIRLVRLLPSGKKSSIVECEILHGEWDNVSYEALSYAWGDTSLKCSILVDGQKFMVTENLHGALKGLRHWSTPRTLWIDAICINQVDNEERSDQVRQMRYIYETARGVIIWLGSDLKGLGRLTGLFEKSATVNFHAKESSTSKVFYKLLDMPWWKRMWVIQELVVAQKATFQCGRHSICWDRFRHFVQQYEEQVPGHSATRTAMNLIKLRDQRELRANPKYGLLSLAMDFEARQAGDGRDKLYALLGLLSPDDALITPDYTKDELCVFRDFTKAWVNRYKSLLIITVTEYQFISGDPWYPVWSERLWLYPRRRPLLLWWESLEPTLPEALWEGKFSASGGHPAPNCAHPDNDDILHLRGFVHDTIIVRSEECAEHISKGFAVDWDGWMTQWRRLACETTGLIDSEIDRDFHRTVTAGVFDSKPAQEQMAAYTIARNAACEGQRFFITSRGAFGLAPGLIGRGDKVCVLLGAAVPFVLRDDGRYLFNSDWKLMSIDQYEKEKRAAVPSQMSNNTRNVRRAAWKFVCEAYVHGIMTYSGDIGSDIAQGRLVLEDFFLY